MNHCWFCHGLLIGRDVRLVREGTSEREYAFRCGNCGAEFKAVISVTKISEVPSEDLTKKGEANERTEEQAARTRLA